LAVKEAQERHLTEEWTEKWKEAANILKEQQALALKRTGQGVMLDSEKPHLVNILHYSGDPNIGQVWYVQ
jgi:kinesin family protein 16B